MKQEPLNFDSGPARRDAGMQQAADHAGEPWGTRATWLFAEYARLHRGRQFLTEDARGWAEVDRGLLPPPDQRAWGFIARNAAKAGVVRAAGYGPCSNPSSHAGPRRLWVQD